MRRVSGMLLIGSAGRNSGKTEFACSLIRKCAARVVGVKVTAIRRKDGACPRGGKGCGVCTSLEGNFCLTEETDERSAKDTARLLAAGADRVFWLRALISHLTEGTDALLKAVGPGAALICESNSLRRAVEPDLFFLVQEKGSREYKDSARAVRECADRTVFSDGRQFDFDLDAVRWNGRRWILREHAAAIVLAGGSSRRMQQDKALLQIGDRPLIQHVCDQLRDHFDEVLVSANDPEKYAFLGVPVIPDRVPGLGPLMGIASALEASRHDLNLVVACDIPELDLSLAHRLLDRAEDSDAVVPRLNNGRLEPLFAVYRKRAAGRMHGLLAAGERRIRGLFDVCPTRFIDLPRGRIIKNLNTMEAYVAYVGAKNAALR